MLCAPGCPFTLFADLLLTIFLIFWARKILLMLSNHLHICRTDEDAEREELFLSHSETDAINISPNSEQGRKATTKTKSRREAISKSKTSEKATTIHSEPSCSTPRPAPFGLMSYASSPSQMTIPILAPPHAPADIHYHNQCSYPVFPMHPPNSVMPFVYWPQPNTFAPFTYASSYRYIAPGTCISVRPYCSFFNPLIPQTLGTDDEKQNGALYEDKRESNSSSSSTDSREK